MEEEKKTETIVKPIKKINIKLPGPLQLIIYAILILALSGVSIFTFTSIFKSQEKILQLGLEDIGELVTQTCRTTVLEDSKVNLSFFSLFDIPFTESRQLFSYDFDVLASLDFKEVKILNIDDNKKEIKLMFPHSKVYKPILIPQSFKSYLDTDGLFSRIDLTKHNEALLKMEEEAKNICLNNHLLENADTNAQKLLSAFLKGKNAYKNYNIIMEYA